jgi:hypothetical protein
MYIARLGFLDGSAGFRFSVYHPWCEKPLALAGDELDEVATVWRRSERQLTPGYNRRWAPPYRPRSGHWLK